MPDVPLRYRLGPHTSHLTMLPLTQNQDRISAPKIRIVSKTAQTLKSLCRRFVRSSLSVNSLAICVVQSKSGVSLNVQRGTHTQTNGALERHGQNVSYWLRTPGDRRQWQRSAAGRDPSLRLRSACALRHRAAAGVAPGPTLPILGRLGPENYKVCGTLCIALTP